jgi:phosphate transport system substrate-binding protein
MRSLAAAFAMLVVAGLALTAWTGLAGASSKKTSLTGAGSSFVAPLVAQWSAHYAAADINYSAIGSGAGIAAIRPGRSTSGPVTPDDPWTSSRPARGCVQIPWAFSATSMPYNVSGVGYGLKLTGPILANIYLGHIKKWNDKQIKAINKGVNLPNEDIVPIYRSDGSGTSFNFTDYLSKVSKEWKRKIGKGTQPAFPAGVGARGSSGVAAKLGSTPGGITYVDIAYAYKNNYKVAKIRNRAGKFVLPTVKSLKAVASTVTKVPKSNAISVVDPSKSIAKGYSICTYTWVIVPLQTSKAADLKKFIDWASTKGQKYGLQPGLLFLPLSKVVQTASPQDDRPAHTHKLSLLGPTHARRHRRFRLRRSARRSPTRVRSRGQGRHRASCGHGRTEEALEEPRRVFLGHAGAVVARLEHDGPVFPQERERAGRTLARVADRVFEQVVDDGPQHAAADRKELRLVLDPELEAHARPLRALEPLVDRRAQHRRGLRLAERNDFAPLLQLAKEEDVVDELGHLLDLVPGLPEELGEICREAPPVEQGHEPGKGVRSSCRRGERGPSSSYSSIDTVLSIA